MHGNFDLSWRPTCLAFCYILLSLRLALCCSIYVRLRNSTCIRIATVVWHIWMQRKFIERETIATYRRLPKRLVKSSKLRNASWFIEEKCVFFFYEKAFLKKGMEGWMLDVASWILDGLVWSCFLVLWVCYSHCQCHGSRRSANAVFICTKSNRMLVCVIVCSSSRSSSSSYSKWKYSLFPIHWQLQPRALELDFLLTRSRFSSVSSCLFYVGLLWMRYIHVL